LFARARIADRGLNVAPRPKPTVLKQLAGNPGRRPLNAREPQPRAATGYAPRRLSEAERKYWRDLAPKLLRAGLLTELDTQALERMCELRVRIDEALKTAKKGLLIKTASGNWIQNPAIGIVNRAYDLLVALEREFGMTPSSRTKVAGAPIAEEKSIIDMLAEAVVVDGD